MTAEIVDVIFKCFDEINGVIESVASGEEPTQDLTWIIARIKEVSENTVSSQDRKGESAPAATGDENTAAPKTVISPSEIAAIKKGLAEGKSCSEITVYVDASAQMKWVKAQLVLSNLGRIGTVVATIPPAQQSAMTQ